MSLSRGFNPRALLLTLAGLLLAASAAAAAAPADSSARPSAPPTGGTTSPTAIDRPPLASWPTEANHSLARPDRLQHASLAFAIGLGAGLLTDEPAAAFGSAATLGLAKEVADRHHGGFDATDLWADLVGALLAALATYTLRR